MANKKIRVIFYKAKWGDKHWLDNAISIWTGLISAKNRKVGPYSHVEIQTANGAGDFWYINNSFTPIANHASGTCWTSTMRGKDNGTVKRPADTVINNRARWDYCEIEMDDAWYEKVIAWMTIEVDMNHGYSKRDLLKFFGLGFLADHQKNICSEFCNNAINKRYIMPGESEVVSPRRLAWKLQKAGYQIKPLS
jgi:hypothetical protein